ncbi:MAG: hypothetical protein LH645_08330 [Actinomycetia bacterium]|nr:hypothetical protein [Actinomycetes bacterium]
MAASESGPGVDTGWLGGRSWGGRWRDATVVSRRSESSGAVGFDDNTPLFEVDETVVVTAEEHGVRL